MSALLKELQTKTAEINDIKAKLIEELRPSFKSIFESFFDKYKDVTGVRWKQYTPYFNDGEPCEFSVHSLEYLRNDAKDDDGDYEDGWMLAASSWLFENPHDDKDGYKARRRKELSEPWGSEEKYVEFNNDFNELDDAIQNIPEDVMQDLFGDHAEIIVTRDGIEVEEYSHD